MAKFHFIPEAKNDLKSIGRYTTKVWGKEQRNLYLRGLDEQFKLIAEAPDKKGKQLTDIDTDLYMRPHKEHQIFYLVGNQDSTVIIAILHKRMDELTHLVGRL